MDLSKLKEKKDHLTPDTSAKQAAPSTAKQAKPDERKFQHYASSRTSMRMITDKGKPIAFAGYKFITADQDVIDYIDSEIAQGLKSVTKGELLTSEEADPMAALRRQMFKEFKEMQDAGTLPEEYGATKSEEEIAASIKPATTNDVAN